MAETSLADLKIDRTEGDERRRRRWPIWVAAIGVFAVGSGWWVLSRPIEVKVAVVRRAEDPGPRVLLNASGYVTARREATVSSKVTGKVVEVLIEEGKRVEIDEVLARLDEGNVGASLRFAEAQLAAAKAALEETRVRLSEAAREEVRVKRLVSNGVSTEAEMDRATAEVEALKARLEKQQTDIVVADREVAVWRQHVEDTVIRAPFGGIVTAKNAQPGEMISPVSAGGGYTRTGICTIVDMASLEIEVDVNESYINRVSPDQPVEATLDAYPDWKIPASVIAIIPTADRQKATVKVRIRFAELDPRVLPEMAVKVAFLEREGEPRPESLAAAPKQSLIKAAGGDAVWVLDEGKAGRRDVVLFSREGDDALIERGLSPGEVVIVEARGALRDGARVRPQAEEAE